MGLTKHGRGWAVKLATSLGLVLSLAPNSTDAAVHLYELRDDPSESEDLKDLYTARTTGMINTLQAYREDAISAYKPNLFGRSAAMELCGGVCPWEPFGPNNFSWEVPRLYNTAVKTASSDGGEGQFEPPHITFILVDDWGWNDFGLHSNWIDWATPNLDSLAKEGIEVKLHFVAWVCAPCRASLLTGLYTTHTGFWAGSATLRLNETLLPQELQSAGYATAMIGKWHLGWPSAAHLPSHRGFDRFYGFLNKGIDYWNKTWMGNVDLQDQDDLVTDIGELTTHNGLLLSRKAVEALYAHETAHPTSQGRVPFFLYYAPALVHSPWQAPEQYTARCGGFEQGNRASTYKDNLHYCGMTIMLDESVANITCAMRDLGWSNNSILVMVSDNGGDSRHISGANDPYRGGKNTFWNGGITGNAFIHSQLIPAAARGSRFQGLSHITDWFPTLMHAATDGAWSGTRLNNATIDGVDLWDALLASAQGRFANNYDSPRTELLVNIDVDSNEGMMLSSSQNGERIYKLMRTSDSSDVLTAPITTNDKGEGIKDVCARVTLLSGHQVDEVGDVWDWAAPTAQPSVSSPPSQTVAPTRAALRWNAETSAPTPRPTRPDRATGIDVADDSEATTMLLMITVASVGLLCCSCGFCLAALVVYIARRKKGQGATIAPWDGVDGINSALVHPYPCANPPMLVPPAAGLVMVAPANPFAPPAPRRLPPNLLPSVSGAATYWPPPEAVPIT